MAKVDLKFVPKNGDHVSLEMHVDGKPAADLALDAAAVTGLIDKLVSLRAGMSEQVSATLKVGERLNAVSNPAWVVNAHGESQVLALRHPGHGWVSFLLPQQEATDLAGALNPASKS